MTDDSDELLDHVAIIGEEFSADLVRSLAADVREARTPGNLGSFGVPTPSGRELVNRLVEIWRRNPEVSPGSLALALEAAQRSAEIVGGREILELVWTGPKSNHVAIRRTDQALRSVIDAAERELQIVSFAAFGVREVMKSLEAAVDRNVDVKLILETPEDSAGKLTYGGPKALGPLAERLSFYVWPSSERPKGENGRHGLLHAKVAVADGRVAFVTSANLTDAALIRNMELGLIVRGGRIPQRIADHFRQLIGDGVLQPLEPS